MEKIINAIRSGVDRYQESQLSMLEKLCNIDSGSKNVRGNRQIVEIIDSTLNEIGAEISHVEVPGYGVHIVARIKAEQPTGKIVLAAHLDTVFKEGDAQSYPFHIDGEYAYGLGAADCKGGVVTILYAVKVLKEANLLPEKDLVLILNCDEEIGSPTSQELFKREAADAEAVLSFEPGRKRNGILTSRYGVAEGTIKIKGKSAHACMDGGPGANAVLELANLIIKLDKKEDPGLGIHYNVAPISGGIRPSVVANYAEASFWVTGASNEAFDQIKKDVIENLPNEGVVDGCEISTTLDLKFTPMERHEINVELYEKIRKAGFLIGIDLPEEMSKSPGDCNFYSALGVPTVDGLGPYMYNLHTVNEHIQVSSLPERTKLVSTILATI